MKSYNFYGVFVDGKWKIFSGWSYFSWAKRRDCDLVVNLESNTRYLAKKELAKKV